MSLMVRSARLRTLLALLGSSTLLAGCATLPSAGPTAGAIESGAKSKKNTLGFQVQDLTPDLVAQVAARRAAYDDGRAKLASLQVPGAVDVVGPGDILSIAVYEVGVGLFGGAGGGSAVSAGYDPSAHSEAFREVTVDRNGTIALPYIGRFAVAGRTPAEIEAVITRMYRGQSQSPQVIVGLKENVTETVIVSGEVRKPGKLDLTLKGERILDGIALSGGIVTAPEDTVVRFTRGDHAIEERFDALRTRPADDLRLNPGDRIEVIRRPRSFLVLGATTKVSQVPFETSEVSLAEAIARVGGPNDALANASGIFVFRFEPSTTPGGPDVPVIYRVNMLKPASYFMTQRFAIQDKDVVYISTASSNAALKFVTILNQLFSPAFTILYATRR